MTDTEMILEQLKSIKETVGGLDSRMGNMEAKMEGLDSRMGNMEAKVDGLDSRMDNMEAKMEGLDSQMGNMEAKMEGLREDMESFKGEMLDEFQKQNDTLNKKSDEIDRHLHETEHNLKVYMENVVDKRITTLIEGFETNQEYIDRNTRTGRHIGERVDDLETRVAVLEDRTSA